MTYKMTCLTPKTVGEVEITGIRDLFGNLIGGAQKVREISEIVQRIDIEEAKEVATHFKNAISELKLCGEKLAKMTSRVIGSSDVSILTVDTLSVELQVIEDEIDDAYKANNIEVLLPVLIKYMPIIIDLLRRRWGV